MPACCTASPPAPLDLSSLVRPFLMPDANIWTRDLRKWDLRCDKNLIMLSGCLFWIIPNILQFVLRCGELSTFDSLFLYWAQLPSSLCSFAPQFRCSTNFLFPRYECLQLDVIIAQSGYISKNEILSIERLTQIIYNLTTKQTDFTMAFF